MIAQLFVGNLGFEYELASSAHRLPNPVRRLIEELSCLWIPVAEDGDFIWTPAAVEPTFLPELSAWGAPNVKLAHDEHLLKRPVQLCPWGWTPSVRNWADRHRWHYVAPPQAVIQRVNSRQFSSSLEKSWGVGLPGTAEIRSEQAFTRALRDIPQMSEPWVVKADLSTAARERVLGRGREPTPQVWSWVRKRLRTDGVVFLEPWVDRLEEIGLQFTIPQSGPPQLEGIVPLLTDGSGTYRGSRFSPQNPPIPNWQTALEVGMRVAIRLQQEGYFGPLGIDSVRYRDADGNPQWRPIQDINARYTMGRLSLGFRRWLPQGEYGTWLHFQWPATTGDSAQQWLGAIRERLPTTTRIYRTAPFRVSGRPTRHGSAVILAPTADDRETAETILLGR